MSNLRPRMRKGRSMYFCTMKPARVRFLGLSSSSRTWSTAEMIWMPAPRLLRAAGLEIHTLVMSCCPEPPPESPPPGAPAALPMGGRVPGAPASSAATARSCRSKAPTNLPHSASLGASSLQSSCTTW